LTPAAIVPVANPMVLPGLPVVAESKDRLACVRRHVTEHPLHRREVPMRRKTDRLRPRGKIAHQLAGVARIDGNHRRPGVRRLHVHLENFVIDRFEYHILDADTEHVDQKRT